jgi:type IV pilus assembly protein PilX
MCCPPLGMPNPARTGQRGAALVTVLLVLLVVEILGVAAVQMALMGERSARSHRDAEVAWQAAEAALADAELDMTQTRAALFDGSNAAAFAVGCGTSRATKGLCANADSEKPAWLAVDFTDPSGPSAAYGELTGRTFNAGSSGVRPALAPRYVIELVPDTSGTPGSNFVYRVTAIGFGPRPDIQAVLQMVYRI